MSSTGAALDVGLVDRIREEMATRGEEPTLAEVASWVGRLTGLRGTAAVEEAAQDVLAHLTGFGVLHPLLEAQGVTDVLVNADGSVFVDDTTGLRTVPGMVLSPDATRRLAVRLVSGAGKRLDDACPYADVVVGGVRVHAVLPPVAQGATLLSLRRVPQADATLDSVLPDPGDPFREALSRVIDLRLNFLVSGGTGAGKTTLLSAMLGLVPTAERIVAVEDAPELRPNHPHCVSLASRAGNTEGAGVVTLTDLVRQALRMRPDRLVVGECRGEEVRDVLMALNTGHDGAGATLHANSPDAVGSRLLALGALGGWDVRSTTLQAAAAVDVVVHTARSPRGRRPVALSRLVLRDGVLTSGDILTCDRDGGFVTGPEVAWFDRTQGRV
ncbi:TadA family conjugal transfer-associated ATPase [Galactobacter sp.]|uniref:TadA family conjugal transfer-associated ATPase n=1 Tax=Galactobacter sp. TaxID=2676125 RepID=UPI0025C34B32|nr:TadA family conjugal transfer-associated ATPase [Galactobacter sp.]